MIAEAPADVVAAVLPPPAPPAPRTSFLWLGFEVVLRLARRPRLLRLEASQPAKGAPWGGAPWHPPSWGSE